MNIHDYKFEHPHCELASLFPRVGGEILIPFQNTVRLPLFGRHWRLEAHELHHVVGQTSRGRTNDERNVLHLNHYVHSWLTDNTCAGRILCCRALKDMGRLDWAFLSGLDRKNWPGIFDTDPYIEACKRYPWVEECRTELIRKAA